MSVAMQNISESHKKKSKHRKKFSFRLEKYNNF